MYASMNRGLPIRMPTLSATIPEPRPMTASCSPAFRTRVRIATLKAADPSGPIAPIDPV